MTNLVEDQEWTAVIGRMDEERFPAPQPSGLYCGRLAVAAQLGVAAALAFHGGQWRDGVVLLAGAAVNGVMAT